LLLPASYAGEYYLCDAVAGQLCRRILFVNRCAGTYREALEIAGMLINFRSGKFGYSICPIFSKGHAKFFCEILHDFAKNRTYGVS
jgi:hypothetical protein